MSSTRKQKVLIHIGKNQIGMDDDEYRDILENRYKKKSSKDLTYNQAEDLIRLFKKLGFKPKGKSRKYEELAGRPGMATPGMLRKIEAMWAEVTYSKNKKTGLRNFLFIRFGVSDLKFLTMAKGNAVIEALKRMKVEGRRLKE